MRKRIWKKRTLLTLLFLFLPLLTGIKTEAAGPVMEIIVKDGYSARKINFYYGKTPSGYTGFYADTPSVLVHPKSKKVTFSVKNSDGTCSGVNFQHSSLTPSGTLKSNLMRFDAKGRTRAYMLSVKKVGTPEVTSLKLQPSNKKRTYHPNGKNNLSIKADIRSEIETGSRIVITNAKDQVVFQREFRPSDKKRYSFRWYGRVSVKNEAGLPRGSFAPAGVYKVTFSTTIRLKKYQKTVARSRRLRIV